MDCNSVAASLCDISDASFEVSVKVFVIADQVCIARLAALDVAKEASDLSTSMRDLAVELRGDASGANDPIVNLQCLHDIMASADSCQSLVQGLQYDLQKVGQILRKKGIDAPKNVRLSRAERPRWPFSQPQIHGMIDDLKVENGKLFLILLVIRLARSRQVAGLNKNSTLKTESQDYLADAINIIQRRLHRDQRNKLSEMDASGQDKWKHVHTVQRVDVASTGANLGMESPDEPVNDLSQSSERPHDSKTQTSPPDIEFREARLPSFKSDPGQAYEHFKEASTNKARDGRTGPSESDKPSTTSHLTGNDEEKEMEGMKKVLQLHFLRPRPTVWDDGGVGVKYCYNYQSSISPEILVDEVARMKLGPVSLVDQLTQLTAYEDMQLREFLFTLHPRAVLISVHKGEPEDIHFHSITMRGACGIRVIIETCIPKNRPTYIKCHIDHLDPRTLDEYNLPWIFDEREPDFVIVKRWLPEKDQEILFEHTRLMRERRCLIRKPRLQVRSRGSTKVDRREALSGDESDDSRSLWPGYDSDKEDRRRIILERNGTSEASNDDFAKELLARYTTPSTLPKETSAPKETSTEPLDKPKLSVGEPTLLGNESNLSSEKTASVEPKLPAKQALASPDGRIAEKYEFV